MMKRLLAGGLAAFALASFAAPSESLASMPQTAASSGTIVQGTGAVAGQNVVVKSGAVSVSSSAQSVSPAMPATPISPAGVAPQGTVAAPGGAIPGTAVPGAGAPGAAVGAGGPGAAVGAGVPGVVAPGAPPTFSPREIERLKLIYNGSSEAEKAQMRAAYQDMGVDLLVVIGLKRAGPAPVAMARPLPDVIRALNFARKPEAVLAARTQLGLGNNVIPDRGNTEAFGKWFHTQILAGEWGALDSLFETLPPDDATAIYSHILRSTNEGSQGLLPEEVLAIADACPGEMADWQIDVLCQMLTGSAQRYGTGPFLTRIQAGTKLFGAKDDASRERTVRLLVGSGLALEAFKYLPSLEDARARGDARVIYAHGRYHEDLAAKGTEGPDSEAHLEQGWGLLAEVALMPKADVALRKEAMKRAFDLLMDVPPAPAKEWMAKVFASPELGPAALEVVALQAINFKNRRPDSTKRAQGLATMKQSIDTLLKQPDTNAEALRIPLRMLTTALADEVETTVKEKGDLRGVPRETELLFRAAPDERWLSAIEPSVAIRGYRAAIDIATVADETDAALDTLAAAVKRFPDQSRDFADDFLKLWERRLNPRNRQGEYDWDMPYFYYGQQRMPSAPLTRGRQQRNLERLQRLVSILNDMGVPGRALPSLTPAFQACHAKTEVYDRAEIEKVFGPIESLPAATTASLAESMRLGLSGDWRNRQTQQQYGMARSSAEIGELVEAGYELAIQLAEHAIAKQPDSWKNAVLHAALSYDRVRFKQTQKKEEVAKFNEYRRQAFAAFERASKQYAELVAKGQERDSAGVYLAWFAAVMDAGQPTQTTDDVIAEETLTDDQIERIGASLKSLPAEAYQRHVGMFARDLVDSLPQIPPEKKPTIVRAATRIVGPHPAGAPIRRLAELYQDLLKNEIRLRLTVDGDDRVASGKIFGLLLALRYTNSVDRETGGFDKYLYQDAYVRVGNQYRQMNYQGSIQKGIESALGKSFTIESIGFFEPLTPSRAVHEEGQSGWQEKPLAYILARAKDPSVDRIPQMSFDMHFEDTSGPVTLPILSNAPVVDASAAGARRPVKNLKVQQTLDLRRLEQGTGDRAVTIEVNAQADGVIPEIRDLLKGLDGALPGYEIPKEKGIEERPYTVTQTDSGRARAFYGAVPKEEDKSYAKADESGIFRLSGERSWLVTYKPTGAAVAGTFVVPQLAEGVEAALTTRQYADMDLVEIKAATVPVLAKWGTSSIIGLSAIGALLLAGGVWFIWFRKPAVKMGTAGGFRMPAKITPLSTIAALERIRAELLGEPHELVGARSGGIGAAIVGGGAVGGVGEDVGAHHGANGTNGSNGANQTNGATHAAARAATSSPARQQQVRELSEEIASLQAACFGPSAGEPDRGGAAGPGRPASAPAEPALRSMLERWARVAS